MGIYLTMNPGPGTTDERRNCISNVRDGGLGVSEGVRKLGYLVEEAFRLGYSGVGLKDRMAADYLPFGRPLPELARNCRRSILFKSARKRLSLCGRTLLIP